MAQPITAPVRGEPVLKADGTPTQVYADFWGNIETNVNDTVTNAEAAEGALSEIASVTAIAHELSKRIDEVDELISSLGRANARIAELEKTVNNLSQLVE